MKFVNSITLNSSTYRGKTSLTNVNLANVPWKDNSMEMAFSGDTSLISITNINNNVSNMYKTFNGCSSLENSPEIPNSITDMRYTFSNSGIKNINIPTSIVNLYGTFENCSSLTDAPNMNNYINLSQMKITFSNCTSLTTPPNLSGCTNLSGMTYTFANCTSLTTPPNFSDCTSLTSMDGTFSNCTSLTTPPNLSDCTSLRYMNGTFENCSSLSGQIEIFSEKIISVLNCFNGTSLEKNVYIPFNMTSEMDFFKKYAWLDANNEQYYTIDDIHERGGSTELYFINDVFAGMIVSYLNEIDDSIEFKILENSMPMRYDSANTSLTHKNIGDSSFTYDAFTRAGYSKTVRVDGVLLKDLYGDDEIDLSDWEFSFDGDKIIVSSYKGNNENVILPNIR